MVLFHRKLYFPPGGYSDIFMHKSVRVIFCIQSFKFQYFLGFFFQEIRYFWGYKDFVDIFLSHHKIGLYSWVISMHFRVFSYGQCTEWGIFFGLLKFQLFFGVLEIPVIFYG